MTQVIDFDDHPVDISTKDFNAGEGGNFECCGKHRKVKYQT